MKIEIGEITKRCHNLFVAEGLTDNDASILTDVLLQTEMRGVFTHGFKRVSKYIGCLKSDGIKTKSELNIISDTPSWASVDGGGGLGIIISKKATELAISKAEKTGVGIVNVKNSHHFGAAGYYSGMCADKGMIGMSMSNGDVLVAATGSREKTIGNNPFSFAAPAGKYDKIVYDIAMSHTSDQKVLKFAEEGKTLPKGWLIDKNGNDTQDPSDYEKGGTLLPFGGYKGYGMAMMVETLASVLSGAAITKNVHAWNTEKGTSGNTGHFFMALDIKTIMPENLFISRMETMIDEIKKSEKAENVSEIFYPGEIELRKLSASLSSGFVEIADETMKDFENAEKNAGLL